MNDEIKTRTCKNELNIIHDIDGCHLTYHKAIVTTYVYKNSTDELWSSHLPVFGYHFKGDRGVLTFFLATFHTTTSPWTLNTWHSAMPFKSILWWRNPLIGCILCNIKMWRPSLILENALNRVCYHYGFRATFTRVFATLWHSSIHESVIDAQAIWMIVNAGRCRFNKTMIL